MYTGILPPMTGLNSPLCTGIQLNFLGQNLNNYGIRYLDSGGSQTIYDMSGQSETQIRAALLDILGEIQAYPGGVKSVGQAEFYLEMVDGLCQWIRLHNVVCVNWLTVVQNIGSGQGLTVGLMACVEDTTANVMSPQAVKQYGYQPVFPPVVP